MLVPLIIGGLVVGGVILAATGKPAAPPAPAAPLPAPVDKQARLAALRATLTKLNQSYTSAKVTFERQGIRTAFEWTSTAKRMEEQIAKLVSDIKALEAQA